MSTPQRLPIVLRTAAVWGTTVLAVRNLNTGQSLKLSDGEGNFVAKPDTVIRFRIFRCAQ